MFDQPDGARIGRSLGAGLLTELVVIGIVLLVMALLPKKVYQAVLPDRLADDIVWLSQPGPGGGGGGGNKMPDPPKKAELKGEQKISVPTPPEPKPEPPKEEPPPETLNIPAQTLAAAPGELTGRAVAQPDDTRPPARARGSGAGAGQGSGLGPGIRRWHRRWRVPAGQWRQSAAADEGSEAAIHRRRDAREGAGHCPARMRRAARRQRRQRRGGPIARLDIRPRSGSDQGGQASGGSAPARASASRSRCSSRSS